MPVRIDHRWRWVLPLLAVGLAVGCQSVPQARQPIPAPAEPEEYWLFDRLLGQGGEGAEAPEGATRSGSGVRPVGVAKPVPTHEAETAMRPPAEGRAGPVIPPPAPGGGPEDRTGKPFELEDLAPERTYQRFKNLIGLGPNEDIARERFDEGRRLFLLGRYQEAAKQFRSAASRWPDSPLEEDALFLLSECHFFLDRYPKAHETYNALTTKYDNSRHLDVVVARQFAIGRYWDGLDHAAPKWALVPNFTDRSRPIFSTFSGAIDAYTAVRLSDPTGPYADHAAMATANAYFLKGRWEDAALHYETVRRDYPQSEHQLQAHLLGMKALEASYQGPMYDGTPLFEAVDIADATLRQFRGRLEDQEAQLRSTRRKLEEAKAERDLEMARFYEAKRQYGAARFYYEALIREYPQSQSAQRARLRLAEIAHLPDRPPDHFAWLTRWFGEKR